MGLSFIFRRKPSESTAYEYRLPNMTRRQREGRKSRILLSNRFIRFGLPSQQKLGNRRWVEASAS